MLHTNSIDTNGFNCWIDYSPRSPKECLQKSFAIIIRKAYTQVPPKVEYYMIITNMLYIIIWAELIISNAL